MSIDEKLTGSENLIFFFKYFFWLLGILFMLLKKGKKSSNLEINIWSMVRGTKEGYNPTSGFENVYSIHPPT